MVQCVFGNNTDFIDEWEVSFKSIIFNAPLESNLHLHIIGNLDGIATVEKRIEEAKLINSCCWRNKILVTLTNVEYKSDKLIEFLRDMITKEKKIRVRKWMDLRLGI